VGEGVGVTVGLSVTRASVDAGEVAGAAVAARGGGVEQPAVRSAMNRNARIKVRIDGA